MYAPLSVKFRYIIGVGTNVSYFWIRTEIRRWYFLGIEKTLGIGYSSSGGRGASPSNTVAAGPVIYMGEWPPCQLMCKSPPNSCMTASWSAFWVRMAAARTAQAPVPQARVSPLPRSHTRMRSVCLSITFTNSVFIRLGKLGWCSKEGPIFSKSEVLTSSSRKLTQWGFPMEMQVT